MVKVLSSVSFDEAGQRRLVKFLKTLLVKITHFLYLQCLSTRRGFVKNGTNFEFINVPFLCIQLQLFFSIL